MATGTVKCSTTLRASASSPRRMQQDVFVHHSAISGSASKSLAEGQQVKFDIEQGRRPSATNGRLRK